MKLEDLPDGARVFVDANILIYHFSGISVECRAFLQRCEFKQVDAFTGVHILRNETTPDQIRYVLVEVRQLLYAHSKIDSASAAPRWTSKCSATSA
jgi:predicted nucleic acid-binding protein